MTGGVEVVSTLLYHLKPQKPKPSHPTQALAACWKSRLTLVGCKSFHAADIVEDTKISTYHGHSKSLKLRATTQLRSILEMVLRLSSMTSTKSLVSERSALTPPGPHTGCIGDAKPSHCKTPLNSASRICSQNGCPPCGNTTHVRNQCLHLLSFLRHISKTHCHIGRGFREGLLHFYISHPFSQSFFIFFKSFSFFFALLLSTRYIGAMPAQRDAFHCAEDFQCWLEVGRLSHRKLIWISSIAMYSSTVCECML